MNSILIYDSTGGYSRVLKKAFHNKYNSVLVKNIDKLETINLLQFDLAIFIVNNIYDMYSLSVLEKEMNSIIIGSNTKKFNFILKADFFKINLEEPKSKIITSINSKVDEILGYENS